MGGELLQGFPSCPKITVITPSYNQGRFLERCMTSVLSQDYDNLEYIVIDGGSTDQSQAIIRKHADHLAYWISEKDHGQSDAINKGFARATGDLVAWMNADDFYLSGAFKAVAEAYQADPDAPFYFGDGIRVDEAGNPRDGFFPNGRVTFNRDALIFGLNYILQPAVFINRRSLMEVGYLDPQLQYGMDTDLWIRLSGLALPVSIPRRLAASREYQETKTATGSFERIEELRSIAKKYSGLSITPGVLCYFLHTLDILCLERPDIYPPRFRKSVRRLWEPATVLLAQYGANTRGFPDVEAGRGSRIRKAVWRVKAYLASLLGAFKSMARYDNRG